MKKNKVHAFTLSEMLVVLVVASIVIAIAFTILNMVRKQLLSINKNFKKKQEIELFESRLYRDFNSNNAVYQSKNEVLILKNLKDSITYVFKTNYIVREKDTFRIEVANKKVFMDGQLVKDKVIDAMEINLSANFYGKQIFVYQIKDASYYLNP